MEWKIIPGFNDYYRVSDEGMVESRARWNRGVWKPHGIHLNRHTGYQHCGMWANDIGKTRSVHRLVMECFRPLAPEVMRSLVINHKDCDKTNNRLSNLEWCSYKENSKHFYALGTMAGEKHHNSKLTDDEVVQIRCLNYLHGVGQKTLNKMFNTTSAQSIIEGKTWRHI